MNGRGLSTGMLNHAADSFSTPVRSGILQRKCSCGGNPGPAGECAECRKKKLQRRSADGNEPAATVVPPIVHRTLASPGRPLDPGSRSVMETQFGHDFSKVRVHSDELAAESAAAVNARAYTVGSHVVFGAGGYGLRTGAGRRLLAHELTHVVQQSSTSGLPASLEINRPYGTDEREADTVADQIMHGSQAAPAVRPRTGRLQRQVVETPQEHILPGAEACLVHLHGDEQNALSAAQALHRTFCANLVHLNSTGRCVTVNVPGGGSCTADPNRIFSADRITRANAFGAPCGCPPGQRTAAVNELRRFRTQVLGPAISRCRDGNGVGLSGRLPVIAFHNNTPGALSISSYQPGGSEAGATETDPTRSGRTSPTAPAVANPHVVAGEDPDDFMLVTDPRDFAAFQGSRNVVLQSTRPTDDGSLSVALRSERYINVEAQDKPADAARTAFNIQMGKEALNQLRVSTQPCNAPRTPSTGGGGVLGAAVDVVNAVERVVQGVLQALERELNSVVPTLPREAPPVSLPRGCLLAAIQASSRTPGPPLVLPSGSRTASGLRSFSDQERIWLRKFQFRGGEFDRISGHARQTCGSLLAAGDVQWNPGNPAHRVCWGAPPRSGTTPPAIPAGARALTDDEKQQEILLASSAPGISRHHFGSDFDLFGVEPDDFQVGGPFADEYSWLQRNASTYGFIQSFTSSSGGYGVGYIEERWHWSYYPLAQALLEFARTHQTQIEAELARRWGTRSEFSFISAHWRDFMFNVSDQARF